MNENDLFDLAKALYERASLAGFPRTFHTWIELTPSQRSQWVNLASFAWVTVKAQVLDAVVAANLTNTAYSATLPTSATLPSTEPQPS